MVTAGLAELGKYAGSTRQPLRYPARRFETSSPRVRGQHERAQRSEPRERPAFAPKALRRGLAVALAEAEASRQPVRRSSKSEGGKRQARERVGESEGQSLLTASERSEASHANGASRRSGERESV